LDNKEYEKQLYILMQLALRTYVGRYTLDELLENKENIATAVFEQVAKNTNPDIVLQSPVGRSGRPQFARQPGGISALNEYQPVIDTLHEYCEAQGLKIDALVHN